MHLSEIIMNQIPSHSQMPEFDANKSQTTSVLFQPPKPEEMRTPRFAYFWVNAKEFFLFTVLVFVAWIVITLLLIV